MTFNKKELEETKTYLAGTKAKFLDPKATRMAPADLEKTRKHVQGLQGDMQKQLNALALKQYVAMAATVLTILTIVMAWLLAQPFYVQIAVGVIVLAAIGVTAYIVLSSKDPRKTLLELIELAREIIDIINNLPIVEKPVANFMVYPAVGRAPLTVTYTDKSSGLPTSWLWKFGDGATSNQQNVQHVYTQSGEYTFTLTVSNASGQDSIQSTITVTPPGPPPSEVPPGVELTMIGSVELAKIGGEHQIDMNLWLTGGDGWPGGTVRVMDSSDPDFDVLPNDIWAYWYDGGLAPKGWLISQQGYYYLKNTLVGSTNCIHSMVDRPWVQPGKPVGIPLSEVMKIERENDKYVLTVLHDGVVQRIVWGKRE